MSVRLLFVQASPEWTGATRVFATVAHDLATRGYATALAVPEDSAVHRIASRAEAAVLDLPAERHRRHDIARVVECLESTRAETVFVHGDYDHDIVAAALKKVKRGALVRRLGAGEVLEPTPRARRAEKAWPVRYLYTTENPPSGHAAPSGSLAAMRADLGVPVPEVPADPPRDGYGVVACIASREALRRATHVLRALAMMTQQHPTLRLRVIGTAAGDPDLQVLASALGLTGRVEWITQGMRAADVLAGVSAGWVVADGDDLGLGLLHLMAHGIVPLGERSPVGMRYVTPGVHGILLAQLEPPAMAAETTVLLADRARRATMGAAARARVEREFTLREMLAGFETAARATRAGARASA